MARIRQFSHSCFVLDRERYDAWQKSRNCSCRRKKAVKILGTKTTACHFATLLRCHEDDSTALLEYFQFEDGHQELGPNAYSEIIRARRHVLKDHRCVENIFMLIHYAPVALNPTAVFFQSSKTVTLMREGWKTLKRLLCIFSVRHYFRAFMSERSFWGKVTFMKDKPPRFVHVYQRKNIALHLKSGKYATNVVIKNIHTILTKSVNTVKKSYYDN